MPRTVGDEIDLNADYRIHEEIERLFGGSNEEEVGDANHLLSFDPPNCLPRKRAFGEGPGYEVAMDSGDAAASANTAANTAAVAAGINVNLETHCNERAAFQGPVINVDNILAHRCDSLARAEKATSSVYRSKTRQHLRSLIVAFHQNWNVFRRDTTEATHFDSVMRIVGGWIIYMNPGILARQSGRSTPCSDVYKIFTDMLQRADKYEKKIFARKFEALQRVEAPNVKFFHFVSTMLTFQCCWVSGSDSFVERYVVPSIYEFSSHPYCIVDMHSIHLFCMWQTILAFRDFSKSSISRLRVNMKHVEERLFNFISAFGNTKLFVGGNLAGDSSNGTPPRLRQIIHTSCMRCVGFLFDGAGCYLQKMGVCNTFFGRSPELVVEDHSAAENSNLFAYLVRTLSHMRFASVKYYVFEQGACSKPPYFIDVVYLVQGFGGERDYLPVTILTSGIQPPESRMNLVSLINVFPAFSFVSDEFLSDFFDFLADHSKGKRTSFIVNIGEHSLNFVPEELLCQPGFVPLHFTYRVKGGTSFYQREMGGILLQINKRSDPGFVFTHGELTPFVVIDEDIAASSVFQDLMALLQARTNVDLFPLPRISLIEQALTSSECFGTVGKITKYTVEQYDPDGGFSGERYMRLIATAAFQLCDSALLGDILSRIATSLFDDALAPIRMHDGSILQLVPDMKGFFRPCVIYVEQGKEMFQQTSHEIDYVSGTQTDLPLQEQMSEVQTMTTESRTDDISDTQSIHFNESEFEDDIAEEAFEDQETDVQMPEEPPAVVEAPEPFSPASETAPPPEPEAIPPPEPDTAPPPEPEAAPLPAVKTAVVATKTDKHELVNAAIAKLSADGLKSSMREMLKRADMGMFVIRSDYDYWSLESARIFESGALTVQDVTVAFVQYFMLHMEGVKVAEDFADRMRELDNDQVEDTVEFILGDLDKLEGSVLRNAAAALPFMLH